MGDAENYELYRKAREQFTLWVYILLLMWLILAVVQWVVVLLVNDLKKFFSLHYYICFATFAAAVIIFVFFLFMEKLRFTKILNFFIGFVIVSSRCTALTLYPRGLTDLLLSTVAPLVELHVVAVCAFVSKTNLTDLIVFFVGCLLLMLIAIVLGTMLPKKIDLTLDVAIIFVLSFIFMIIGMYFIIALFVIPKTKPYTFLVMQICIAIVIVLFIAYHAQTIRGSRFAEMRLNDYLLGSLILFHDFLIVFYTTFYWSVTYEPLKTKYNFLSRYDVKGRVLSNDTDLNMSAKSPTFWGELLNI